MCLKPFCFHILISYPQQSPFTYFFYLSFMYMFFKGYVGTDYGEASHGCIKTIPKQNMAKFKT